MAKHYCYTITYYYSTTTIYIIPLLQYTSDVWPRDNSPQPFLAFVDSIAVALLRARWNVDGDRRGSSCFSQQLSYSAILAPAKDRMGLGAGDSAP